MRQFNYEHRLSSVAGVPVEEHDGTGPQVIYAECDREHALSVVHATGCVIDRELFGFGPGCLMLAGSRFDECGPVTCTFALTDVGGAADAIRVGDFVPNAENANSLLPVYRRCTLDGIEFREVDD